MKAREYENINGYTQLINTNYEDEQGGGTSDYKDLSNKPKINSVELKGGNNTLNQLGIQGKLTAGANITIENNVISSSGGSGGTIDTEMSPTSENAVQNKVITSYVDLMYNGILQALEQGYQPILSQGDGIYISPSNQISVDNTIATKTELNDKQETLISGENIKTINNESLLGSGNITIQGGDGAIDKIKVNGLEQSITNKIVDLWVGEVKQEGTPRYNVNTSGLSVKGKVRYVDNSGMNTSGNGTLKLVKDENGVKATALIESSSGMFATGFTDMVLPNKNYVDTQLETKQPKLTAGANITIDSNNVISASGGSGGGNTTMSMDALSKVAQFNIDTNNYVIFDLNSNRVTFTDSNGTTDSELQEKLKSGTNIKTINNQNVLGSGNINIKPNTWNNWQTGQDVTGWNYRYRLDTTNKLLECFMTKTLNIGCTATSGNFFRSEPVYIDHLKEFSDNLGLGHLEILDVNINVIKSGYPIFTSINSINSAIDDFELSFYLVSGGSRNATNYEVKVHFISTIESY